MNSKLSALRLLSAVVMLVMLASCSSPTPSPATSVPQPTVNVQATLVGVQTQAVQTFVAKMTQSAPTATKVLPTKPPAPTAIPATATVAAAVATDVPTQKPPAPGRTATSPSYCTVSSVLINGGTDAISAGDSFKITFVVTNTGSTTWDGTFNLMYWSGMRFTSQQRISLPFSVGQGSNMTVPTLNMTAPPSSGTYHAVWAITKGFTTYCLLPVTLVVK